MPNVLGMCSAKFKLKLIMETIQIKRNLAEEILDQLKGAQADQYVQSTENVINDLNQALHIPFVSQRRELLLAFYQHLIDNDPFPINSFSKEREVDRFLKANNCG